MARKLQNIPTAAFRDSTYDEEAMCGWFLVKTEFGKNIQKTMRDE